MVEEEPNSSMLSDLREKLMVKQHENECLQHVLRQSRSSEADRSLLASMEEKIAETEEKLLCAEERILAMKAEKYELLQRIERLQDSTDREEEEHEVVGTTDQHNLIRELQEQISVLTKDAEKNESPEDLLAQEEKMAVILEQEQEIHLLKKKNGELIAASAEQQQKIKALIVEMNRLQDLKNVFDEVEQAESGEKINVATQVDFYDKSDADSSIGNQMQSSWVEEIMRHPTPSFDINSPEIQYLLNHWTTNRKKIHYLHIWLQKVIDDDIWPRNKKKAHTGTEFLHDSNGFPTGIELPRLLPEIRDGFLALVVPLLRRQLSSEIQVHTRKYDENHSDLRIRVTPRSNIPL